jgi:hypothetical protein
VKKIDTLCCSSPHNVDQPIRFDRGRMEHPRTQHCLFFAGLRPVGIQCKSTLEVSVRKENLCNHVSLFVFSMFAYHKYFATLQHSDACGFKIFGIQFQLKARQDFSALVVAKKKIPSKFDRRYCLGVLQYLPRKDENLATGFQLEIGYRTPSSESMEESVNEPAPCGKCTIDAYRIAIFAVTRRKEIASRIASHLL